MPKYSTPRRRKARKIPVMIVETNADHWLLIRSAMYQCFPEAEPVWINDAAQAIAYLETNASDINKLPRLILADLYLPRKEDGLALIEFVKNYVFYRKPPLVILSSSQDEEDIAKVYSLNASSYIVKPERVHEWHNYFYTFRRYWWEIVTLPLGPPTL